MLFCDSLIVKMMRMKIAIVKLSALGDIVHTMAVLQFIKKYRPEVAIDWFVDADFKAVLDHNPDISNIHIVRLKKAKQNKSVVLLVKALRQLRKLAEYDLVIDCQGLIKSALVAKFIPSKRTIGFGRESLREKLAVRFYTETYSIDYGENIIKRNVFLVASALEVAISDTDIQNKQPFLFASDDTENDWIKTAKPTMVIVPGASFAAKIYPASRYAQLVNQLGVNAIVIWGNDSEKNSAKAIQALSGKVQIAPALTLNELKILLSKADLVVGGDTGPTHMAWALNRPSITIFGATPGYRNTLATHINQVIESDSVVNPYKIDRNDCSIETIEVAAVVNIAKRLLNQVN